MEDGIVDLLNGDELTLLLCPEDITEPVIYFIVAGLVGDAHRVEGLPKGSFCRRSEGE